MTTAGYALAALAYAVLAVLLLTRWRGRMRGSLLLLALLATVAWGVVFALGPAYATFTLVAAQVARDVSWIVFLTRAFGSAGARAVSPWLRLGPLVVGSVAVALGVWAELTPVWRPPLGVLTLDRIYVGAGLLLAIFGFVLVEQGLRNTREGQGWAIKFVWLGAGALFAYDVALFAASYVLNELQPTLAAARGYAVALTAPLVAIGVHRLREFRPQAYMSQQLAFYTTSVVIAGLFLVAVSVGGYYVRVFGGTWGGALQVLLVFAALVGLAVVVLSGAARARLRVWLAKHWFPYKYDYRNEWLDLTERLTAEEDGSSLAQRSLEAFKRLVQAGGGVVLVRRDDSLVSAAGALPGVEAGITEPVGSPFARHLEEHEWILDLLRARAGSGRDADVPVPDWLANQPDAWLAVPLIHGRRLEAIVVLRQPLAPQELTWEDLDLLRTAARQAASYFALEQAGDALASERQFAALNRFTAFLMHDLSNVVAQQRLIVENAARHKHNPAFVDDAIETIDNTVRRMGRLLEQLKAGQASQPPRRVALAEICTRAVERLGDREPRPTLEVADASVAAMVGGDRLEHVLEHVIRNAQDATAADGTVKVALRAEGNFAVIDVTDSGRGMDPEFVRERLFRPFDTTKGAKGMGIGAFQTREFARASGGDVRVSSAPGKGTSFVIVLPRAN